MKRIIFFFAFLIGFSYYGLAQDMGNLVQAFGKKDLAKIEASLNSKVQIIKSGKDNIYSKPQAKMVLSSFFKETKPVSASLIHQGKKATSSFVIFTLKTEKGNYRIYCLEKQVAQKFLIHQIRIDKQ